MRDSGLLLDSAGQTRTFYSLRHTYATLALLEGGADIHTLSKHMGNSAAMIERHYSKLTTILKSLLISVVISGSFKGQANRGCQCPAETA